MTDSTKTLFATIHCDDAGRIHVQIDPDGIKGLDGHQLIQALDGSIETLRQIKRDVIQAGDTTGSRTLRAHGIHDPLTETPVTTKRLLSGDRMGRQLSTHISAIDRNPLISGTYGTAGNILGSRYRLWSVACNGFR